METIAERIIKVAEFKCKNMSEFANQLKVTPAYISKLKKMPEVIPSERFIDNLCRLFNINETWIMTGEGEMEQPLDREEKIADIAVNLLEAENTSPLMYELIEVIMKLDESDIETLHDIAKTWINKTEKK